MEDLWAKLKELQDSRSEFIVELGEKRYAIDRLSKELQTALEKLDEVATRTLEVLAELEKAHGIPEGGKYSMDMEKKELIYEPEPDQVIEEETKED